MPHVTPGDVITWKSGGAEVAGVSATSAILETHRSVIVDDNVQAYG